MRRILLGVAGVLGLLVVVLVVEVVLARTRPRLDDEVGTRPRDLLVGADRDGDPVVTVWFGDSTSTGVGATTFETSVAHRVAVADAERLGRPVSVSVFGVSGDQVHEVVNDQLPEFAASGLEPELVYVSVGANDVTALTRRPTFRGRYRTMLDELARLAPDAEIVVLGVPDMGSPPRIDQPLRAIAGWRGRALDTDIRKAAADRSLTWVDIAGETGPPFRADPGRYFSGDDFHPSDDGYALWAEAVVAATGGR